ncbi:hypothetical protein J4N46_09370 [Capnocytophaga sp. Marseille-Q4570]|uniref:STAS domain-containing protein n=1 Tax=Capnocytophaga bilenii TaxID=2819369 RepID=A0ABS3Q039_9FLAO|nr:hypothetical protein [Capnocytophaga bilenii]MBO1884613.1 hypothetical protein [Capnocytophaga bilenii]
MPQLLPPPLLPLQLRAVTELDLSNNPQISILSIKGCPITNIKVKNLLASITASLSPEGIGIKGETLLNFVKQLAEAQEGDGAEIVLSPSQVTDEIEEILEGKGWNLEVEDEY